MNELPVEPNETPTTLRREYIEYITSSSIRISDETKRKLELIKRENETDDELLARLATIKKTLNSVVDLLTTVSSRTWPALAKI